MISLGTVTPGETQAGQGAMDSRQLIIQQFTTMYSSERKKDGNSNLTNEEKNYKYFLPCRDPNCRPSSPEAPDLPVRHGTFSTVNSLLSLLSNLLHLMLL